MPCYDGRDDEDRALNYQLGAVLCGIITKNGIGIIDNLNWKEIGVKKQVVLDWWHRHEAQDRERRAREQRNKEEYLRKQKAAKLLSKDELVELLLKRK